LAPHLCDDFRKPFPFATVPFLFRFSGDFPPKPVFLRMEENFVDQLQILIGHRLDSLDEIRSEGGKVRQDGGHDMVLIARIHRCGKAGDRLLTKLPALMPS